MFLQQLQNELPLKINFVKSFFVLILVAMVRACVYGPVNLSGQHPATGTKCKCRLRSTGGLQSTLADSALQDMLWSLDSPKVPLPLGTKLLHIIFRKDKIM